MASEERYEEIAYAVASSGREPSLSHRFFKAMFTRSGSTGVPKLIFVSHACLLPNLHHLK